jgi:uncharacterized membrane protein affecting hemolysin expression
LRVKPVSASLLFATNLITGLGLVVLWSAMNDDDARIDHFGSTLTRSMASQVMEPFVAGDLIHLGVLTNRTVELPEVVGATIYTVDDRMLSLSGDVLRGRPFTREVVHDESIIGYVRLHIDDAAFAGSFPVALILTGILWVCLVPVLLLVTRTLMERQLTTAGAEPDILPMPEPTDAEAEDECRHLIVVNLFNQLTLSPDQRAAELAFARAAATRVAGRYRGQLTDLPGTGLLLWFGTDASDDRPFHVLCAAFALRQLLTGADTWGNYRLSVHCAAPGTGAPQPGAEPIADAAVLSALARDHTLVVSAAFFDRIPYPQRFHSEPMRHPLLDELETIGRGARLASGLAQPHDQVVAEQVEELEAYSEPASARESTF